MKGMIPGIVLLFLLTSQLSLAQDTEGQTIPTDNTASPSLPVVFDNPAWNRTVHLTFAKPVTLYALKPHNQREVLRTLAAGTECDIVAETVKPWRADPSYVGGYYLIRQKDSLALWDGWIERKVIPIIEPDYRGPGFLSSPNMFIISPNNEYVAYQDDEYNSEFSRLIVRDRSNHEVINILIFEEIVPKLKDFASDGAPVGWSQDSRYAWFDVYADAADVGLVKIDVLDKRYVVYSRPLHYGSFEKYFDFDLGIMVYSDYPFQITSDDAEETKRSGEEFHLYQWMIGTPQPVLIETNNGVGFSITEKQKGQVQYYSSKEKKTKVYVLKK